MLEEEIFSKCKVVSLERRGLELGGVGLISSLNLKKDLIHYIDKASSLRLYFPGGIKKKLITVNVFQPSIPLPLNKSFFISGGYTIHYTYIEFIEKERFCRASPPPEAGSWGWRVSSPCKPLSSYGGPGVKTYNLFPYEIYKIKS